MSGIYELLEMAIAFMRLGGDVSPLSVALVFAVLVSAQRIVYRFVDSW